MIAGVVILTVDNYYRLYVVAAPAAAAVAFDAQGLKITLIRPCG